MVPVQHLDQFGSQLNNDRLNRHISLFIIV